MPASEPTRDPSRGPRRSRTPDVAPGPGWRRSPSGYWLPPHAGEVIEASSYNVTVVGRPQSKPAAAPAVSPADYAPLAWWDAGTLSTLFQNVAGTTPVTAAGQPVGRVLDRSGNNRHLAAPGDNTTRPTYSTTAGASGALPAIVLDGSNDYLSSIAGLTTSEHTVILVCRHASASGYVFSRGSTSDYFYKPQNNTLRWGNGGPSVQVPTLWPANTAYCVLSVVIRPTAATTAALYRDGTLYGSSTAATGTGAFTSGFFLGSDGAGGTFANLYLHEVAVFGAGLTDAQRAGLETGYFKPRWGTP